MSDIIILTLAVKNHDKTNSDAIKDLEDMVDKLTKIEPDYYAVLKKSFEIEQG